MLKVVLSLVLLAGFYAPLSSQSDASASTIPVIDMRGYDTKKAIWEAVQNTKQDAVVVLIRGGDNALLKKTKSELQALVNQGYTRVGIIRSVTSPGEIGASLGVFADGTIYASIKNAKPSTEHMWSLHNLVKDAYTKFVLSKTTGANTGG